MPLYQYRCPVCLYEVEEIEKFSDEPRRFCPRCESLEFARVITGTNFALKGGGWYKDLYASKKAEKAEKKAEK